MVGVLTLVLRVHAHRSERDRARRLGDQRVLDHRHRGDRLRGLAEAAGAGLHTPQPSGGRRAEPGDAAPPHPPRISASALRDGDTNAR